MWEARGGVARGTEYIHGYTQTHKHRVVTKVKQSLKDTRTYTHTHTHTHTHTQPVHPHTRMRGSVFDRR